MAVELEFAAGSKIAAIPPAAAFPRHPATWYLLCRSSDIARRPFSDDRLDQRLVAFRDAEGRVAVLDARCSHLGADLGRGSVIQGRLCCPFHHWQYDRMGSCVLIPGSSQAPCSSALRIYPAVERHGYIFFFNGPKALFPLPFFADCDPSDFAAAPSFQFEMDTPWYMLVSNAFDEQHFRSVHDRKLQGPPRIDCPAPFARRMQLEADIVGTTIFDRLLRRFVGAEVGMRITSWGGPHVLVEGIFRRAHSRLLVASRPLDDRTTHSDVIVFARRGGRRLPSRAIEGVNLRIRRRFTQAFLQNDIDKLRGVRYQPQGLTQLDQDLIEYFRWVSRLPRSEYEARRENSS